MSNPGLQLPPGYIGNGGAPPSVPARASTATSGAAQRPPLHQRRPRRLRSPAVEPVRGPFRATLAPADVAANVQPVQVGVPDPAATPQPVRRRLVEEDPYAPVGLRVGNVNLYPVLAPSIGYDTNPNRTQLGVKPSVLWRTEGELGIQSDWSRHDLFGNLRGAYNYYPDNQEANRPDGAGQLRLRLDATRDTEIDIAGAYLIDTLRPGSPELNARVRDRPVYYTEGAAVGITHRVNRLLVSLRGTVDRTDYADAVLTSGTILDQSDRNLTAYGLRGRVGYEIKPGLIPFAEVIGDTRQYDQRIDRAGLARSSDGIGGRLGTSFELTRLLTGEISGGVQNRVYEDKRLGTLLGPTAEAALAYALTPVTTIRAVGSAGIDETVVIGANGIRTYRGALTVSHDFRRNFTVTAGLTAAQYDYQGVKITDRSFGALLRADYRLNRNVTVRASYGYDQLTSTIAGSSYATNVFLIGLRLQP